MSAPITSTPITSAPVLTAIPSVPETIAPTEVTKKISREEMIAKGILLTSDTLPPETLESPPVPDWLAVFQGLIEPPIYQNHHFDSTKWNAVKPRADDIVIVTAYKSGTTWMQQIVSEILFQGQEKPGTVGDMSPWVDLRVPPAEVLDEMLEGQTWRRFLKTHMPADAFLPYFQPECDPLPTWTELGGDVSALFDTWLTQGWPTLPDETDGWPFWSYFKNVKTWWELAFGQGQNNILFVHFNNMKADLDGEMRKIAEFLEVPVNEEAWAKCVLSCTFDEMHKNAEVVAPLNGALWEGGAKSFIFKGTNERWRGVLSEDQVAAYEDKASQELGDECAKFMATGSIE
eukprot:CAMPEP_0169166610 /NCGR_PEP_ID=MMETSP1015-20121227/60028_1 /TAXON_ID=342587 /ORGANISM="Karlodinium micrum, Strain CCMP2283" /LENGTH=344 /DNA_ID=CAMNT_0009239261 /DNA_START=176 /DNA_END=1208 /DNA_ORIENTATION=-